MIRLTRVFAPAQPLLRHFSWADTVVLGGLGATIWALVRLASIAPLIIKGPDISLSPSALPLYAALSTGRMFAAYVLSILFSLVYGFYAASDKRRERVLLPILDILQSVPILSYLPIVVMGLTAIFSVSVATELSAVLLIFTSQAWNLTFSWYQSLTTIPKELREAGSIFQFNPWMRFKSVELPFGFIGLVWNSMMSWAGGWFALMAAEMFTTSRGDFRLPGLGSYIQQAADDQNVPAIVSGILTLVFVIVALDQLMWRPLLAIGDRFKLDMVGSEESTSSWVHDAFTSSRLMRRLRRRFIRPATEAVDGRMRRLFPARLDYRVVESPKPKARVAPILLGLAAAFGLYQAVLYLVQVPLSDWGLTLLGLMATLVRVFLALALSLAWTVPLGVAIGTNARLAKVLQPLTQFAASLPATALYPLFLVWLLHVKGGLEIAALLLMLAGTQWYLLFNVIAGAKAIPQDLKYTAQLLGLSKWEKWKTFILPALFPYIATGLITASGGAWNASIFAEYTKFGGSKYATAYGIGAIVAKSQGENQYPLLMASTVAMVGAVILINRLVWKRVYALAEEKYRME